MSHTLNISLIGIPEDEKRRLEAICAYSVNRPTAYHIVTLTESGMPDILIVNADEKAPIIALRRWLAGSTGSHRRPPMVIVTAQRDLQVGRYQLHRPLIASRVLNLLDMVALKELKHAEVNAIGDLTRITTLAETAVPPKPVLAAPAYAFKALVVDDSLPVRIQMDQVLKTLNAQVDFAETGEKALTLVADHSYDIIFLDVFLPGADGYEICKTIRRGKAKHTPVIMLTSKSSPADRLKGKLAGCDTYLIKPVGQGVFKELVEHYLRKPVGQNVLKAS